ALVALGTTLSTHPWAAAALMVVVGVAVRFTGYFGGPFSASVSPAILAYVLGATVPASTSAIPDRVGGWIVAGLLSTCVALVVLPRREHHLVCRAAARACDALAVAFDDVGGGPDPDAARAEVTEAFGDLRRVAGFCRRCGPSAHDLALTFVVDELRLLMILVDRPGPFLEEGRRNLGTRAARQLRSAAAALRGGPAPDVRALDTDRATVRDQTAASVAAALEAHADPGRVLADLDADFLERLLLYLATSVQANVSILLTGHRPDADVRGLAPLEAPQVVGGATLRRAVELVRANAVPTSAWLRDSVRAGVALGAAVLVADLASVDHAFWVALGTLAVLRSNAFETGRSALGAALGTSVGFLVSSVFFALVGLHRPVLWLLTVLGAFLAAYLPQIAGFIAGQAAFTLFVVALFNLVLPTGWRTGLVRVQDVVIGALVSLVVAFVFWPRRAADLLRSCTVELYRALADESATTSPVYVTVRRSERRAHAAMAQYLDERRKSRRADAPWATMLGVAGLGRTGLRLIGEHRRELDGSPARDPLDASTAGLGATWRALADALERRALPGPVPSAREIAESTRPVAIGAITAASPDDVDDAIAVSLWRDWLVEQSALFADARDAVWELGEPGPGGGTASVEEP
ncbi:MAG TPA: FUSC family protein, partial [Acidimicrobiia bacterium]|nr:FUSC family protein [Acidimicrobiia bacterium]